MYDFTKLLFGFVGENGKLTSLPAKRKKKIAALFMLSDMFDTDRTYTEKEINTVINDSVDFRDPELVRRELIVYGFLNRKPDGSEYTKPQLQPLPENFDL